MMSASPETQLISILGLGLEASQHIPPIGDWDALQECARRNRVLPLLYSVLADRKDVPDPVLRSLRLDTQHSFVATTLLAQVMKDVSEALDDIPWMLLRGPILGEFIYGDLSLRPYGDLDVLVSPNSVDASLDRLKQANFLPPPGSFSIAFYRKYHLHVQLSRAGLAGDTSLELHWALDHPFTLLTVDVDAILNILLTTQRYDDFVARA